MQETQIDLLSETDLQINTKRRKHLLPWWIKVFIWIFLFFGLFFPVVLFMGIMGYTVNLGLYGFQTNEPLSIVGILLLSIFILKAITAFALLTEMQWAIKIAVIDAVFGIILCIGYMAYPLINSEVTTSFRLEIVLLFFYLMKLIKIRAAWENSIQK